ncbi:MAG: sigma-54 dependent transcriptional regulator [Puniceicoccales bacterium]|jgi:DNA-binding NtrC family response regulator|nr:sigma-54 dependent transcriptional regulator [Puniceicoccales bacterium]
MLKLLIVDEDKSIRETLKEAFQDSWDIYLSSDHKNIEFLVRRETIDVVLSNWSGLMLDLVLLNRLRSLSYAPICIVVKTDAIMKPLSSVAPADFLQRTKTSVEMAVQAMKRGAFDFITSMDFERLRRALREAAEERKKFLESEPIRAISQTLPKESAKQREFNEIQTAHDDEKHAIVLSQNVPQTHAKSQKPYPGNLLCAADSPLISLQEKAIRVAKSNANVLLQGETGTGKEIFAHWIHYHSPRASGPMVTVHCAALPENLLESELFGHERGAFTGAMNRHVGYFERAHHGTIFLDEIGEINLQTQVKLLRFIETLQIERIGGTEPMTLDVRLITATHRPLEAMIREGSFREDLYYRLNVIKLQIPALRDRPMDIPILLDFYLQKACYDNGIAEKLSFSSEALDALQHYFWPGNIRELRHTCESAAILMPEDRHMINLSDLDPKFVTQLPSQNIILPKLAPTLSPIYLEDHQGELTQQKLQKVLKKVKGNKTLAARQLGISRRTLYRKLQEFSVRDSSF